MRKKTIRNLVLIHCFLLTFPGLALAAESTPDSSEYVLDEVIVNAVPLEKYLVTTSVITDKDIEEKGAKNLSQVLEDVPGVNIHRGKKNANTLDIRGSAISYTKIYVDSVLVNPLSKASGDSIDLNMIPVDNIAKIEVIKGPAPVSYGTDAMGGIILITTKNGKAYQGGKVSLSGGSDDTRNVVVSYGDGDDKFNYYFNAGTEHTDGFIDNADRKHNYFNAKLNWKVKENAILTFTGGYSNTDKGVPNAIDPDDGHFITNKKGYWAGLPNWEFRDYIKTNLLLSYAEKVNQKLDYNVKAYRFTEDNEIWADGRLPGVTGNSTYSTARWNASYWDSTLHGVESQVNLKLNPKHTLTFGTLYNDVDWKKSNNSTSNPVVLPSEWLNYNNKRYAYYLQDNFLPNEKTTVTFGIRYDKDEVGDDKNHNKKESATNPTINVVYQLDNHNTLRASYGETISFPTLSDLFGSKGGNPDLKPETAKNYEVGWKHQFDASLTGDIAIFKNDVRDRIDKRTLPDGSLLNDNIAFAKIQGVEIELNKKFTNQCNGFFNYTYLDTTAAADETTAIYYGAKTDIKYTPQHKINYGLTYQADKGYKFSLTGHLVSKRATLDTGGVEKSDNRTDKVNYPTLPAYHVMDLQIKRQINKDQDWYINIYNVFDKDYESELFYEAEGRTVIVGLDYKF